MKQQLVIGYGNEQRGDDAAGPEVARRIAALSLPNVLAIETQQLTPELAESIAAAARVFFVDACPEETRHEPLGAIATPLAPSEDGDFVTHSLRPEHILALAKLLYGRAPPAWLVAIESSAFAPNEPLSPAVLPKIDRAAAYLLQELQREESR
jgi:hydrogenase maturation protease